MFPIDQDLYADGLEGSESISHLGLQMIEHVRTGPTIDDYWAEEHTIWTDIDFIQYGNSVAIRSPLPPDAGLSITQAIVAIRNVCTSHWADINPVTRVAGLFTLTHIYSSMYAALVRNAQENIFDELDDARLRLILRKPSITPAFVLSFIIGKMAVGELELICNDLYHVPLLASLDKLCGLVEACGDRIEPPTLTIERLRDVLSPLYCGELC